MSYLNDLVTGFGITQFALEGYEADDLIATITKQAEREGAQVLICTGDRDSFQLVTEKTTVLYPKRGVSEMARMTPSAVFEKYGMTPDQYPDFAALRGDPSDNLPSVPGVGEKTAAKWIVEYGSLQELTANVDKLAGKVGQSLRDNVNDVIRNRELTQLIHDAPIDYQVDSLSWSGVDEANLTKLFEQLEFRTLKDRLKPILSEATTMQKQEEPTELTLFAPALEGGVLTPAEVDAMIAEHKGEIAVAFEFQDEQLHRYAVAFSATDIHLIHSAQMGKWAQNIKVPKIAHDAKSLARVNLFDGVVFDTALAAYLVNPGVRAQELSDLLERWGDGAVINTSNPEQELLSSAAVLFTLHKSLETEMRDRGVLKLFTDLELPIARLLAVMENRGIAVDRRELEKLATFFEGEVARETKAAHLAAGHEFNVGSPKQLQVVLFDELNLPKTKKIKTGFTTDAEALNWLFEKTRHPLLESLLRIRETKKLGTTVEGLIAEIGSDGRIRTHFAQTVAATGRLSSVAPNLQNIPVRTEEGRSIRNAFVAGSGYVSLLTADYSQIEMRIMAHLSNDAGLLAAFETGEDLHATVAALVFGVAASDVDPEMRRQIKAMSYGLAYGLSAYGLAVQLDLSPPAAQELMDKYFLRFGGIRDYLSSVVVEARKVGYTETVMGRRRYLPDLVHDNRQRREIAERMALNAPIQGSAADIIKQAMLNVQRALVAENLKSRLLLQVHDELILEVAAGEEEKLTALVRREMAAAYPLKAPLDVSVGIGKSWNEAAH
jgi:DNA polymerase-1